MRKVILLLLFVFLASANAGFYGGVVGKYTSVSGSYYETNTSLDITHKWDISQSATPVGLSLGYGFADSVAGEVHLLFNSGDSPTLGTNISYAFGEITNDLYPHILIGAGLTSLDISRSNSDADKSASNDAIIATMGTLQLGVGLSYVLNNTLEFYSDILLVYYSNVNFYNFDYDYNSNYSDISYGGNVDKSTIGLQIGIKFHAFGQSTKKATQYFAEIEREEDRQEEIELKQQQEIELKRQQEIDTFLN